MCFTKGEKKWGGVGWQRILFLEVVKEVGPPGRGGVRRSREERGEKRKRKRREGLEVNEKEEENVSTEHGNG